MHETYEADRERIQNDLMSFADPGGVDVVSAAGRRFQAEWRMRGQPREATFTVSRDRGVTVHVDGMNLPYPVFLADTRMADLKHVARMISQSGRDDIFVSTGARRTDIHAADSLPATQLLTDLMEHEEPEVTQVVMVTGGAGAGKTRVLQELVLRQADRYLQGRTEKLLLYVNAQGRALARLNEALATELQDLRVHLTYHSVATLGRVGLLVLVIDGFDELLGVSGYDDAFSSLATFLEQLDGDGRLIASARSVYYEEEFLKRAGQASATGHLRWSHIPVEIVPWKDANRASYVDQLAQRHSLSTDERDDLRQRVRIACENHRKLSEKPLFFAKTVDLVRTDRYFSGNGDLLGTLIRSFLEREQTEKLLDRQQRPLLSDDRLEKVIGELAEEMWNQETRELDGNSVKEVAEYILYGTELEESERQIVVERMPTLAFLTRSEKHGTIGFEHEVFFFYFLAIVIAQQYVDGADMRAVLSRSSLPDFVAERLAFELMRRGLLSSPDDLQELLDRLSTAGRTEWRRTTQVRENAGLIVLALLREFARASETSGEITGRTISTLILPGGDLSNVTLRNCTLDDVTIRRTNLGNTKFVECHARNLLLSAPRVKIDGTRLELNGIQVPADVSGIQKLTDEGNVTIYDPQEITRVLALCGAPVKANGDLDKRHVSNGTLELLERLMRAYERANPICESDDHLQGLFQKKPWPKLRKMLVEHGVVRLDRRQGSGHSKVFLRRQFPPDEIMKGASKASAVQPQIARFWDAIEAASI